MNDYISNLRQSSFWLRTWTWLCNTDALLCDKAIVGYLLPKYQTVVEKMVGMALDVSFSSEKSRQCFLSTEGAPCISHWVKELSLPFFPLMIYRTKLENSLFTLGLDSSAAWLLHRIIGEGKSPLWFSACFSMWWWWHCGSADSLQSVLGTEHLQT